MWSQQKLKILEGPLLFSFQIRWWSVVEAEVMLLKIPTVSLWPMWSIKSVSGCSCACLAAAHSHSHSLLTTSSLILHLHVLRHVSHVQHGQDSRLQHPAAMCLVTVEQSIPIVIGSKPYVSSGCPFPMLMVPAINSSYWQRTPHNNS
jgi:hypothetical protein